MEKCIRYYSAGASPSPRTRFRTKTWFGFIPNNTYRLEHCSRLYRSRSFSHCLRSSLKDDVRVLRRALDDAVLQEDYNKAALLRDEIRSLEENDPVFCIKKDLRRAVADENYEVAVQLRDKLKEMNANDITEPKPVENKARPVACTSDVLTRGIRIRVRSFYVEHLSAASQGKYVFAYQVQITNEGEETVQLKKRSWTVRDARGYTEQTGGSGVIGQQPILGPGHYFQYMSICPLETPFGTMEGYYEMDVLSRQSNETFYASIGKFGLDVNMHRQLRD